MDAPGHIFLSRPLSIDSAAAYQMVVEVERFPEFMTNVMKVDILSTDAHQTVAAWETLIDDAPLDWVEEGLYFPDQKRVEFRAIEGVFARFDGFWQVQPAPSGCEVVLSLDYEIGLPEIEAIIAPILHERLQANLRQMLDGIEHRAKTKRAEAQWTSP
jgi:ribosome-associated toxin RatA of RatAB toxin-antitoxin module